MIRYIRNILDIKNLLGKLRSVPPTPPEPNENILRTSQGSIAFRLSITSVSPSTSTGISVTVGGHETIHLYTYPMTNTQLTFAADPWSDVKIFGDYITMLNTGQAEYVRVGSSLTDLRISQTVETVDLRAATDVLANVAATGGLTCNVATLYANAKTSILRNGSNFIIANSTISNGKVYLDPTEAEAAQVETAAITKGWTVIYL